MDRVRTQTYLICLCAVWLVWSVQINPFQLFLPIAQHWRGLFTCSAAEAHLRVKTKRSLCHINSRPILRVAIKPSRQNAAQWQHCSSEHVRFFYFSTETTWTFYYTISEANPFTGDKRTMGKNIGFQNSILLLSYPQYQYVQCNLSVQLGFT